jgi:hypothetical protein
MNEMTIGETERYWRIRQSMEVITQGRTEMLGKGGKQGMTLRRPGRLPSSGTIYFQ